MANEAAKMAALQLNASLLDLLECPVCMETCRPPIYMCLSGHHVCSRCHVAMTSCPVCRTEGAIVNRCMALEKICAEVLCPCVFKPGGCKVQQNLADLEDHHQVCEFRYQCPVINACIWYGNRADLLKHSKEKHTAVLNNSRQNPSTYIYNLTKTYWFVHISQFEKELFEMHFQYTLDESMLYIFSRYVGPQEKTGMYKFNLTLYPPDKSRSLSYISPVLSQGEDFKESANCFKLCVNVVDNFTARAGKIIVKRFIEKS